MNKLFISHLKNKYIFFGSFRKNKLNKDRKNIKNKCYNLFFKRHYNVFYIYSYVRKLFPPFLINNGISNSVIISLSVLDSINLNNIKENQNFNFNLILFKQRLILYKDLNEILLNNNLKLLKKIYSFLLKILTYLLNIHKYLILPYLMVKKIKKCVKKKK